MKETTNILNFIENDFAELWIENEILFIRYNKNLVLDLQKSIKICEDRTFLSNENKYPIIADCRGIKYWTKEAQGFMNTPENYRLIKAVAGIYSESIVTNILINFFLKIKKPWIPIRFCRSEQEALKWIADYR